MAKGVGMIEYENNKPVGFGSAVFDVAIYIANRPALDAYPALNHLQPLGSGEVQYIAANTSNHWRKVFNVYAKFIYELRGASVCGGSWQTFRDNALLQAHSNEALLFSPPPVFSAQPDDGLRTVHIIAGKTYATHMDLPVTLQWCDAYFATNLEHRLIVSPYLDYRQLSNARITQLVGLVRQLQCRNS